MSVRNGCCIFSCMAERGAQVSQTEENVEELLYLTLSLRTEALGRRGRKMLIRADHRQLRSITDNPLGKGGMGAVLFMTAEHPVTSARCVVIIKFLRPQYFRPTRRSSSASSTRRARSTSSATTTSSRSSISTSPTTTGTTSSWSSSSARLCRSLSSRACRCRSARPGRSCCSSARRSPPRTPTRFITATSSPITST